MEQKLGWKSASRVVEASSVASGRGRESGDDVGEGLRVASYMRTNHRRRTEQHPCQYLQHPRDVGFTIGACGESDDELAS